MTGRLRPWSAIDPYQHSATDALYNNDEQLALPAVKTAVQPSCGGAVRFVSLLFGVEYADKMVSSIFCYPRSPSPVMRTRSFQAGALRRPISHILSVLSQPQINPTVIVADQILVVYLSVIRGPRAGNYEPCKARSHVGVPAETYARVPFVVVPGTRAFRQRAFGSYPSEHAGRRVVMQPGTYFFSGKIRQWFQTHASIPRYPHNGPRRCRSQVWGA